MNAGRIGVRMQYEWCGIVPLAFCVSIMFWLYSYVFDRAPECVCKWNENEWQHTRGTKQHIIATRNPNEKKNPRSPKQYYLCMRCMHILFHMVSWNCAAGMALRGKFADIIIIGCKWQSIAANQKLFRAKIDYLESFVTSQMKWSWAEYFLRWLSILYKQRTICKNTLITLVSRWWKSVM